MWPFGSSAASKLVAAATATDASPESRAEAMEALAALPQKREWLDLYRRIAFEEGVPTWVRSRAVTAISKHSPAAAVPILLECMGHDLHRSTVYYFCQDPELWTLAKVAPEIQRLLRRALVLVMDAAEEKYDAQAVTQVNWIRRLIGDIPGADGLASEAATAADRLQALSVPGLLQCALSEKKYEDVQAALRDLEQIKLPESEAALAEFRRRPSRLVGKFDGKARLGARDESGRRQVYTSELGQSPCAEEVAQHEAWQRDWERRHPPVNPAPPPVATVPPPGAPEPAVESQDYVAATSAGIEAELLALIDDQMKLMQALHRHGSLAPIAATMDHDGRIEGVAFTTGERGAGFTVFDALEAFREKFRTDAQAGRIAACVTLYHGCHGPGRGSPEVFPAETVADADCIVIRLEHASGQALAAMIQYRQEADGNWIYAPPYFVLRRTLIFPTGAATLPARRPIRTGDQGVHPEAMALWETQLPRVQELFASGSLVPRAAALLPSGEIQIRDLPADAADSVAAEAVAFLVAQLQASAESGRIVASALFFPARYDAVQASLGLAPITPVESPDCLVAHLEHRLSQAKSIILRCRPAGPTWTGGTPEVHSTFPSVFAGPIL